jgi:hypothetical protein
VLRTNPSHEHPRHPATGRACNRQADARPLPPTQTHQMTKQQLKLIRQASSKKHDSSEDFRNRMEQWQKIGNRIPKHYYGKDFINMKMVFDLFTKKPPNKCFLNYFLCNQY